MGPGQAEQRPGGLPTWRLACSQVARGCHLSRAGCPGSLGPPHSLGRNQQLLSGMTVNAKTDHKCCRHFEKWLVLLLDLP